MGAWWVGFLVLSLTLRLSWDKEEDQVDWEQE